MSDVSEMNHGRAALSNRLNGFLTGMSVKAAQYRTYRRTLAELEALTDRELCDLGISRLSIRAIAYRAAYDG